MQGSTITDYRTGPGITGQDTTRQDNEGLCLAGLCTQSRYDLAGHHKTVKNCGRTRQDKTMKDRVWPVYEYRADRTWQTRQDKTVKDCVWPVYEYRADRTWQLGQDKTRL